MAASKRWYIQFILRVNCQNCRPIQWTKYLMSTWRDECLERIPTDLIVLLSSLSDILRKKKLTDNFRQAKQRNEDKWMPFSSSSALNTSITNLGHSDGYYIQIIIATNAWPMTNDGCQSNMLPCRGFVSQLFIVQFLFNSFEAFLNHFWWQMRKENGHSENIVQIDAYSPD